MTPPAEEQLVRRLTRRKELKARESLSHDPIFIEREVTYSLLVSDPLTVMDFEVLGLRLSLKQLESICKIQHRDMSCFPYCMYETSQNMKVFRNCPPQNIFQCESISSCGSVSQPPEICVYVPGLSAIEVHIEGICKMTASLLPSLVTFKSN